MDSVRLPEAFTSRMIEVFGSRDALDAMLASPSRGSVRANPLKTTRAELKRRLEALGLVVEDVPFSPDSLFVDDPQGRQIGLLWEHQAGHYYGQDAASTLPVMALDPKPGDKILDCCAAPGGKTTHVAERLRHEGLVVANEANAGRAHNLSANLDRIGCVTAVVTIANASWLEWPIAFDGALVDAPCSNLGGINDEPSAAFDFSDRKAATLAGMQRAFLAGAFRSVREGGVIVYSTCTIEPVENEGVCSWFLDHFDVVAEALPFRVGSPGFTSVGDERYRDEVALARRLRPGEAGTGGFFVMRFRKTGPGEPDDLPRRGLRRRATDWRVVDADELSDARKLYGLDSAILDRATLASPGNRVFLTTVEDVDDVLALGAQRVGAYFAKREPDALRLGFDGATLLGRDAASAVELPADDARAWMAGRDAPIPVGAARGWAVLTCRGEPVGASRAFGATFANHVPKARRVPEDGDRVGFLAE